MLIIKHPNGITDKEPCLLTQKNSPQIFLLHTSFFVPSYPTAVTALGVNFLHQNPITNKGAFQKNFQRIRCQKWSHKDICTRVLALGFLIGCISNPKHSYLIFISKKITCIALKLHLLPSGNKILNFASVEVSYMLLQKQRKLPWDFIVRKHLETRRIFSIINLPLVHKWCLS